jgi:hypothetical protein
VSELDVHSAAEAARRELDARSPEANRRVATVIREQLMTGLSDRQQRILEGIAQECERRAEAQESLGRSQPLDAN